MKYVLELYSQTLPKMEDGDEFLLCNFGRESLTKILPDDFKGVVTFRRCNLNFCVIDKTRMVIDDCLVGEFPVEKVTPPDPIVVAVRDAGGIDAIKERYALKDPVQVQAAIDVAIAAVPKPIDGKIAEEIS